MATEVRVTHLQGMQFNAHTPGGHDIVLDSGADGGGTNAGPTPMQTVLTALAACGAMDVIAILRKMRQDVTGYEVVASGDRRQEHPQVYTRIRLTHELRGRSLVEANVARAVQLSISRYCPVFAMMAPSVPIVVGYSVTDDATGAACAGTVEVEPGGAT